MLLSLRPEGEDIKRPLCLPADVRKSLLFIYLFLLFSVDLHLAYKKPKSGFFV